jgi:polyphosphate glucokinase
MDLSHLTLHRKYDFDVMVGDRAHKKLGNKKWNKRIEKLVGVLHNVFTYDHLYLGGGNSRCIDFKLPRNVTIVDNDAGMEGGAFAWTRHKTP